jgi:hypothetical protein
MAKAFFVYESIQCVKNDTLAKKVLTAVRKLDIIKFLRKQE